MYISHESSCYPERTDYIFTFKTKLIKETDSDKLTRVSIEFRIPGAMVPAKVEKNVVRERRTLGISFYKLRLRKI